MGKEKLGTRVRREQIAEAALELVAQYGLRQLSVARVARRVGLVPSGIYRHFSSKDEILDAMLDLLEERLLGNVEAAREESPDAVERLRGVLMRHIRFIREVRAIPRIVFSDDVHSGNPERKKRVVRLLNTYRDQIAEIVREGQRSGAVRADRDAVTVALTLFGMTVPAALLWHLTDGGFDVTRYAKRAWEMFLTAIVAPG